MKNIIKNALCVALVLCSSALYAQRGTMMDPAAMKQRLIDSLQLTGVQADSVVAIGQEFRPKMRDIFMDQSLDQDAKRAKIAELNEARNKRIQAVLGADLFKKYHEFEMRNRPQRGQGMMRGNGNNN